jgi:hypothetical protein
VAATLIGTVATDRKVGGMRQCREQIQGMAGFWPGHLRLVFSHEGFPLQFRRGCLPKLHRFDAGCQGGKPDVVPVLRAKLALGNSSRRPTNRANPDSLIGDTWSSQSNDSDGHGCFSGLIGD